MKRAYLWLGLAVAFATGFASTVWVLISFSIAPIPMPQVEEIQPVSDDVLFPLPGARKSDQKNGNGEIYIDDYPQESSPSNEKSHPPKTDQSPVKKENKQKIEKPQRSQGELLWGEQLA